jgi:hypothetical protein
VFQAENRLAETRREAIRNEKAVFTMQQEVGELYSETFLWAVWSGVLANERQATQATAKARQFQMQLESTKAEMSGLMIELKKMEVC